MNIVLINPSVYMAADSLQEDSVSKNFINFMGAFQPLGLLYIAANLENNGYRDITVLDAQALNLTPVAAAQQALEMKPDMIGISCQTFSFLYVLELARHIKSNGPDIKIAVGGQHTSIYPREVMSHACFDFAITGEGEYTFVNLAHAIDASSTDLSDIEGLVYRNGTHIVINPRTRLPEPDLLPFPARHLLPHKKYFHNYRGKSFASIVSTRGCSFNCSYCSHPPGYGTVRFMSPRRLLEEMKLCIKDFNVSSFQFFDDTFLLDKDRVAQICALIRKELPGIEYLISSRVDLLDDELARELSSSGCRCINLGIESGDQNILDFMNKKITPAQSLNAIELCRKHKIESVAFLMVGVPPETRETLKNTQLLIRQSRPNWVKTNVFVPYAGSPVYNQMVKEGTIADFWKNMTLSGKVQTIPNTCKALNKEELQKVCSRFNLIPYWRLKSNLFNFKKIRNPKNAIWSLRWIAKTLHNLWARQ